MGGHQISYGATDLFLTPTPNLPCPNLSCSTLPCPALTCPALPCPVLPYPTLPFLALSCPTVPYPTVSCPTVPYPTVSYPTQSYPDHLHIISVFIYSTSSNLMNERCTVDRVLILFYSTVIIFIVVKYEEILHCK